VHVARHPTPPPPLVRQRRLGAGRHGGCVRVHRGAAERRRCQLGLGKGTFFRGWGASCRQHSRRLSSCCRGRRQRCWCRAGQSRAQRPAA
jgi:hypothetical protein